MKVCLLMFNVAEGGGEVKGLGVCLSTSVFYVCFCVCVRDNLHACKPAYMLAIQTDERSKAVPEGHKVTRGHAKDRR